MAGQLTCGTTFGAINNIAKVSPIFTISHNRKPVTDAPRVADVTGLVIPLANNAAGTATAKAP